MPKPSPDPTPRGTWAALFHQTTDAVFLLNPRRRVRYVNRAWEVTTRTAADAALHEYCHPRKVQKGLAAGLRALLQVMAPPAEAMHGRVVRVRRPVPPAKLGPPWWDLTFVPLRDGDKLVGVFGVIVPIAGAAPKAGGKGLSEALVALRQRAVERGSLDQFGGESPAVRRVRAQAELAAKTLAPVWLTGWPGIGKETLARAIHYHGVTRERAFAGIDCAGLQPYLIRSLLFGHNGLAETGRVGTIYLKFPEALAADLQAELVEWGELLADECRVAIGTTGGNGLTPEFRAAFGVIDIHLPSLAERTDELPGLMAAELDKHREAGLLTAGITPEAATVLVGWTWPRNFRELRETLRAAARRAAGGQIEIEHLPLAMRRAATDAAAAAGAAKASPVPKLDEVLEQVERRMIELALRKTKGDQTAAADLLGVYRSRLVRRIKALGLGDDSQDE
ncbi:MAG TPA: sigma 54-interacting transcriptional regulator [Gemmataceae bacterium]|nr:sigma 54-interacting transcriptional regulator [Gemmataceae bacterium]